MSGYEEYPVRTRFRDELLAQLAVQEAMRTGSSEIVADGVTVEIEILEQLEPTTVEEMAVRALAYETGADELRKKYGWEEL